MRNFLQITVLFFSLLPKSYLLNAQAFKIGFQSGIGTYKMTGLKELNSYAKGEIPFQTKTLSNYPNYYYYQPSIILVYKKFNFGFLYSYHSTGSRISVKDYSGEYRFDSKIKCSAPGMLGEINLNPEKKLRFVIYSEFGFIRTKLNLTEFFKLYDETITDDEFFFTSKNYYFEPGLKISYPLSFVSLEFNIGYFKQFGKKTFEGDNDRKLTVYGDEIKPDWSGLRYGLSIYLVVPY